MVDEPLFEDRLAHVRVVDRPGGELVERPLGVEEIFGLPGDLVLGLFQRFGRARGLEIVTFSHEPAVGFAAAAADSGVSVSPADLEDLIESKGQRFLELLGTEDVLFPGARACVERLSADLALGVASGALHSEIDLILTRADLRRHFICIVAADDDGGHVLATPAGGAAPRVHVSGVEFERLGQAGLTGRYPLHVHLADGVLGSFVRGASIHHSQQRCH